MNFLEKVVNLNTTMTGAFGDEFWSIYAFELLVTLNRVGIL